MGTVVTIEVLDADAQSHIEDAFHWFDAVESCCSKFRADSELCALDTRPQVVSSMLFETLQFALQVAEQSHGAFDPTNGQLDAIRLDATSKTVTLTEQVVIDLGAIAKGLAVDLAAQSLRPYRNFAINAGGDLYLAGSNAKGTPWNVAIRHPREGENFPPIAVSDKAVCTSGDYERGSHIHDARNQRPANASLSATVVAPSAMLADALATAAYVKGPVEGIAFLHSQGVEGMIVSPSLDVHETKGFRA